MRACCAAVAVVAIAVACSACSQSEPAEPGVRSSPLAIRDPATFWKQGGFVRMTPPIRLPSRDGRESIEVWLSIPEGATLGVAHPESGAPTLVYPAGTRADRVDLRDGSDATSVTDVRGTSFVDGGRELFHVLRPEGAPGGARLAGFEWPRADTRASAAATSAMADRLAGAGVSGDEVDLFAELDDCAGCHVHDRAPLTLRSPEGVPNRGTDSGGFFVVQSVLADDAPLERHRALDTNTGDPFVHVTCPGGGAAKLESRGGTRHFACEGRSVPRGHYDLGAALAAGDAHAAAVCESRRYLAEHMNDAARAAFASAIRECAPFD